MCVCKIAKGIFYNTRLQGHVNSLKLGDRIEYCWNICVSSSLLYMLHLLKDNH